jgi:hypothetical protein
MLRTFASEFFSVILDKHVGCFHCFDDGSLNKEICNLYIILDGGV